MSDEIIVKRDHVLVPAEEGFAKVDLPEGVFVADFRKILAASYQLYLERDVKVESVSKLSRVPEGVVQRVMATEQFNRAMELRGADLEFKGLSPQQDLVIQLLSDPSLKGGLSTRLKAAGVSYGVYRAWLQNPAFGNRVKRLQSGILKDLEGDMLVTLGQKAADGDLRAIEYAFEVTGRHDPKAQSDFNVRAVISQIIDILQQEIKDPETLQRIAFRFQGIETETKVITNG